jgi:excinuclease ABC subunit B
MAEELTEFLTEAGVRVRYLHSDVDTLRRVELLRELRSGVFDVLIGINLLREGLDLPEVSLVSILDADKEGFLRSTTSLIQTIGRAARNINGQVHMYADNLTDSMRRAIDETNRRREKQVAYNKERGVDPQPLRKKIADITDQILREEQDTAELLEKAAKNKKIRDGKSVIPIRARKGIAGMAYNEILAIVVDLDQQMKAAAEELKFELAGRLRDEISELKGELRQMEKAGHA